MRDGCQTRMVRAGITPRIITNNTPVSSTILDTQGWEWVKATIVIGPLADADATFVPQFTSSTDSGMAGAVAIPDSLLVSQQDGVAPELAASFGDNRPNEVRKIEILPTSRYVQCIITPSGNSADAFISLAWELGAPMHGSVVQLAA